MTDDLVLTNTKGLRNAPPALVGTKDPEAMNLSAYRAQVASLIRSAQSRGDRWSSPPWHAASGAISQPNCSNRCGEDPRLAALLHARRHAPAVRPAQRRVEGRGRHANVPVIELDKLIPGGSRYFSNTTHFTDEGEDVAAEALAEFIQGIGVFRRGTAH